MKKNIFAFIFLFVPLALFSQIDLSGRWSVKLDENDRGIVENWTNQEFEQSIALPSTTDIAGLGVPNSLPPAIGNPQLKHLTRKHSYLGAAWYSREVDIPRKWKDKEIELYLERVIWKSQVWINGIKVGEHNESLVAPHRFNISKYVKPGKRNRITILVDNRKQYDIGEMVHAYTDETQTIWNGIMGHIALEVKDRVHIKGISVYPSISNKSIIAKIMLENNLSVVKNGTLTLSVCRKNETAGYVPLKQNIRIIPGNDTLTVNYQLDENAQLWSEFNPALYTLKMSLSGNGFRSERSDDFGLRSISAKGNKLYINDIPLFLRGSLECCVFPLTGAPAMDRTGWSKLFHTARKWGLNHLRFHSWCPPAAAFEVADSLGFYLQVELPVWSTQITDTHQPKTFMLQEGMRIINEYGNHPSFCFWSMGNELQKDFGVFNNLVKRLRAMDDRHLYCASTFTFEPNHGKAPEPYDDYFITQYTEKGWVRGQGVFNSEFPSFDKDYSSSLGEINVPLVSHEIGQYSVYPHLTEIDKYTGPLLPLNLISIKNDLMSKGLLEKAETFTQASGKLASILYKEEIERAMKTDGISGFQLLGLNDFPGQGTALVGLLDAFWDSKGIVTDSEFRGFCSPIVPLARFKKACYTTDEDFVASIEVCNYSGNAFVGNVEWSICFGEKKMSGILKGINIPNGNSGSIGNIRVPLSDVAKAQKAELRVKIGDKGENNWNFWVYPVCKKIIHGDVYITRDVNDAIANAKKGFKVLLNPSVNELKGMEGSFVPVFWSPVHFPDQAKSMGLLCNPEHQAFKDFPTDMHTNWQWWDLVKKSKAIDVDKVDGITSIVDVIDNFVKNRRLTSMFETKCGNGSVLVCAFDVSENLDKRPAAKQLLISLLDYMNSKDFNPSGCNDLKWLIR